ncbi:MAG TPA: hypothetical protein VMB73_15805 [Acetobacteraceae bacterium]|nr:hypothetical protein [Acetobacteraceae bacterium]
MANRISPPDDAWRSHPQRDFLAYQLLALARVVLDTYFGNDPEETAYADWRQNKRHRKGSNEPLLLDDRNDDPEHGSFRLTALPGGNTFRLELSHADFATNVSVTYDVDGGIMQSGRIEQFHGEVAAVAAAAAHWIDEVAESDLDEFDEMDLAGMLTGLGSDEDEEEESTDPDQVTEDDRRAVRGMVKHLRKQIGGADRPELTEEDRDWLESEPQSLWPILDGAIAAATAKKRDDKLMAAWHLLLGEQLTLIRYRAERGRDWADRMLDDYQDRLIRVAGEKTLTHEDLLPLVTALGHARVEVNPALSEALMGAGPGLPASVPANQALDQLVRPLIDEMARQVSSPFEVMEAMNETAGVMPSELRCFMAHELALSPHAIMRETVPLMLLDANEEVRRAAALALDQNAAPETLSPVSLRRVIALRNWIPEADRGVLDQAIRKARTKGVQPAQWEPASEYIVRASPIDGSGAQSVVFTGKSGRTGLFAGLLLKQGFGIRDAWCSPDAPRREISSAVAGLQRQVAAPEIERAYVDVVVQNAIAAGVAQSHPPDPALLQIAEATNDTDWKDRPLDVAAESERLFRELPADQQTEAAVTASAARTLAWMRSEHLADSWFEDDAEVNDVLAAMRRRDPSAASRGLLDGPMGARRGTWAERFLLTALWAQAVKPGQPAPLGTGKRAITWRDLAVLAREVLSTRPLHEILVMQEIASRSVAAARSGRL